MLYRWTNRQASVKLLSMNSMTTKLSQRLLAASILSIFAIGLAAESAQATKPYSYVQYREAHCAVKKGSKFCGTKGSQAMRVQFSMTWAGTNVPSTPPRSKSTPRICLLNVCKNAERWSQPPSNTVFIVASFPGMGPYRCGSLAATRLIFNNHTYKLTPKITCWK